MTPNQLRQQLAKTLLDLTKGVDLLISRGTVADDISVGAAITVVPGLRRNTEAKWFINHPRLPSWNITVGRQVFGTPLIVLFWPTLLKQATFPIGPLGAVVHDMLACFHDTVAEFDAVLADDASVMQRRRAKHTQPHREAHPMDVGQASREMEDRFNTHLDALTHCQPFLEALSFSFEMVATRHDTAANKHLVSLGFNEHELRSLSYFDPANQRTEVGEVFPVKLRHQAMASATTVPAKLSRYILHGYSGTDGVWDIAGNSHYRESRLVNWRQLIDIARDHKDPQSDLGSLLQYTAEPAQAAYAARLAYAKGTKGSVLAVRDVGLADLVKSVGYAEPVGIDHPWELYSVNSLVQELAKYTAHSRGLGRLRAVTSRLPGRERRKRNTSVLYRSYRDTGAAIVARKHGDVETLYFTVPYALYDDYDKREHWQGKRIKVGSSYYWSLQGINMHRNGHKGVVPPIQEAEDFHVWAEHEAAEILNQGFTACIYEQRYGERLQAKLQNKRKHMATFTRLEDEALIRFFESRAPGLMSEEEWRALEGIVPGRARSALVRRREHLALFYARDRSYTAYTKSGYYTAYSAARRKRWLKAGVKL